MYLSRNYIIKYYIKNLNNKEEYFIIIFLISFNVYLNMINIHICYR